MRPPERVLVLEDQALFNAYLRTVCRDLFPCAQVISFSTVGASRAALLETPCCLMILDILLPDGNGFDFADEALGINPGIKIVGLSVDCTDYSVYRLLRSPIRVFVDKNTHSSEVLSQAIRAAMAGESYFSPAVEAIRRNLQSASESFPKLLTQKEIDILSKVGLGWSDEQISNLFMISRWTVKWHCRQLMSRLGLRNRADLIVFANRKGFACLHPCINSSSPFVDAIEDIPPHLHPPCPPQPLRIRNSLF